MKFTSFFAGVLLAAQTAALDIRTSQFAQIESTVNDCTGRIQQIEAINFPRGGINRLSPVEQAVLKGKTCEMCGSNFSALGNCLKNAKTEEAACGCYDVDCPKPEPISFSFGPAQRASSANKTYMIGVKTSTESAAA